jgi:hypothetical protein
MRRTKHQKRPVGHTGLFGIQEVAHFTFTARFTTTCPSSV